MSNHDELPVACTLAPEAISTRRNGLLPGLARDALKRDSLENGIRLEFQPNAIPRIAATVDAERRCCRFLRFDLSIEPDGGPVRLTMTGPSGTREFLEALI